MNRHEIKDNLLRLLVFGLPALVLFINFRSAPERPKKEPAKTQQLQQPPQQKEQQVAASETAIRTYNYWCAAKQIIFETESSFTRNATEAQKVSAAESMVSRIRALPAVGVDPEAIVCLQDFADAGQNATEQKKQHSSGQFFVEGFARIAAGDPIGLPLQEMEEHKASMQQIQNAMGAISKTRALLSSRYNVEFPLIP